ncbi:MAG: lysylphosphatidylglycerol synthase transmembrane domain-containing protein [Microthrixaceae bacterium]
MDEHRAAPDADAERAEALAEIGDQPVPRVLPRNDWKRLVLRLGISVAFLALLVWRLPEVSVKELFGALTGAKVAWVVVAVAVHVVAYVLQTVRWAEVSDTLGIHLPFRRMFSHLLAGEFVSNALPTSFGGDVVRVMRQGRDAGDYADAFASTSLERLTGWLVLPFLSAVGLVAGGYLDLGAPTAVAVAVGVVTVLALVAILWAAGHERGAGRLVGRAGWRRYLGAVHLGVVAFRHRPGRAAKVLAAGVAFQFLQCVSVWAAARSLQLEPVTLLAAMAFFPPTAVLQNVPFALGGLGVREAAFVLFFGALGVSDADAIALGLLVYLVFVLASLAGAPSFAVGGGRRGAEASPETPA